MKRFVLAECPSCGADLAEVEATLVGMKGTVPMGYCPHCGFASPLEDREPEVEEAEDEEAPLA